MSPKHDYYILVRMLVVVHLLCIRRCVPSGNEERTSPESVCKIEPITAFDPPATCDIPGLSVRVLVYILTFPWRSYRYCRESDLCIGDHFYCVPTSLQVDRRSEVISSHSAD
jgi:hypothetical protein